MRILTINQTFDRLLDWEAGVLSEDETIELFQHLVTGGLIKLASPKAKEFAADLMTKGLVVDK